MITINPTQQFWLSMAAEVPINNVNDKDVLRDALRHLATFATGKLDLCEVSHILSEVAEEFEEEAAT